MVCKEPQSVVVQVDSIGGALGPFTAAVCSKLQAIGNVDKKKGHLHFPQR